jgi:hypothetical protein
MCTKQNLIFKGDTIFWESCKNNLKIIENIIEITNKLLLGAFYNKNSYVFVLEIFLLEVFLLYVYFFFLKFFFFMERYEFLGKL